MPKNQRWSDEDFFAKRKEILAWWPTGAKIDLDESLAYLKALPEHKVWTKRLAKAREANEPTLLEITLGHATTEQTLEHAQAVVEAGADLIFLHVDAYSRKARYKEAQRALDESLKVGRSLLNGYPIANHGHLEARRLTENVDVPLRYWGCADEVPMLNAEMTYAAGFTSNGSHDVHDLLQHVRDYPLEKRIENNQYGSRLAAWYEEHGVPINLLLPGNLCGWDPPSIKIAIAILTGLGTAEQGCKNISPWCGGTMHLVQDVAALKVFRKLFNEYLAKFGYGDVTVTMDYGSYQGDWPSNRERACGIVAWGAAIAALGGADYVWMRSVAEGKNIPVKEDNVAAVSVAKQLLNLLRWQKLDRSEELDTEMAMMELETRAIIDKAIELGDGDPVVGQIEAMKCGALDSAFTPYKYAAGKVTPIRDGSGAIRWYDHGNLPLPKEVLDYHKQRIAQREARQGAKANLQMVMQDILAASKPLPEVSLG